MKKASTGKIDFDKLDIDKVDRERRRQAIEKNKISNGEIDLLDSIKGYQDEKIIQHLRANGIDGLSL